MGVPPVTRASILAAKAAMLRERMNVTKETGVVIRHDGTIVLPSLDDAPKRVYCEMCDRWFSRGRICRECGAPMVRAAASH